MLFRSLLDFNPDRLASAADDGDDDVDMDGDDGEESEKAPVLTLDEVKKWSKALLEVRPFY